MARIFVPATVRVFLRFTLTCLALLALADAPASATPTENNGLRVLPAPAHVVIDGKDDDWDLSAGIYCCDSVETERSDYAVWFHAMWDQDNLYILARFTDLTPLNNPGQTIADYGFSGDSLQFRVITAPDDPANEQTSHWTCWRGRDGKDIMDVGYGKKLDGPKIRDAKDVGAQQAFTINADGKGYIQEIAVPWKLLTKDGKAPAAGSTLRMTFEPNFTVGPKMRLTIKDLFLANKRPDRVFTFASWPCWGEATLEAKPGPVAPQPVRLADARTFPVHMENGQPVPDWTGLITTAELPGFKTIHFTMPDDGFISLNIKAADGTVVRQLLNAAPYTKGPHDVKWDGLTTPNAHQAGDPVPAGDYTWSALFHKDIGIKLRGWACNAGSAPWDNGLTTNWGGDEGHPTSSAADDTHVYFGWNGAEAGSALLACDLDGNVVWKNKHGGIAGVRAMAAADGVVYVLGGGANGVMDGGNMYKLNADKGDYIAWSGGTDVDLDVKAMAATLPGAPTKADDIAVRGGKIYLAFNSAGKIMVLDAPTGKLAQTLDVPAPGALQVGSDGALYALSGGTSVVRVDSAGASKAVVSGLTAAVGLALDKDGNIYVALGDPDNQIAVYDPSGKELRRIGQAGGRPELGKWVSGGLRKMTSVTVAADGKVWATESFPRRVSRWDGKTGAVEKELFGSTEYGATGGAIDPLDPNVMVGMGCEWKLDPATGRSTLVSVITDDGMGNSRFGVGSNGRLYLAVAPKWLVANPYIAIYERTGEGEYKLRSKFYFTPGTKTAPGNKMTAGETRYWADVNGDGQEQPEESTTVPDNISFSGWYMWLAPDLTFYHLYEQYKVTGFTPAGAPLYDLAHPVEMPHDKEMGGMGAGAGMGSADDRLVIYNGAYGTDRGVFNVYDIAAGKKIWSYPDNFVGVHGSHNATPPEIGMIRGAYDITGTAKLPDPIGNIWVIGTNVGEWHILTGDGFYLTRLFEGDELKVKWPPQAVPGADMSHTPPGLGGEDFGGSIAYGKDGKLYLQAGKTGFWNLEVTGLDTVAAIPGGTITISEPEVAQAESFKESEMQAVVGSHLFSIKKMTPVLTGNLVNDFKGLELLSFSKSPEAAVRAAATWDDQNLYLAWDVTDATPWVNAAKVPEEMYVCGDTVDFQLGTDPNADKKRKDPGAGDLRLSIGNFQGTPTAVLYRKVSDTKKPKTFSSGVIHDYPMDYVDVVSDAKITVKTNGKGYVVEAVVPLADLGLHPSPGLALRGDFGATHGGPDGRRTRLRTYWNNQHTGLVDDAVFELMMEPQYWGDLQFTQ
jgi:hypothetical protein